MIFFWVKENRRILIFITLFFLMVMSFLVPGLVWADGDGSGGGNSGVTSLADSMGTGWFNPESWVRWLGASLYDISSYVLYLAAIIFDNFLAIGLSIKFYNSEFVYSAWASIRDISNIGFILGAIYVASLLVMDKQQWKGLLIKLIVVIFVLNFSLFFARVIVDAGNLTARVFYNSISTEHIDNGGVTEWLLGSHFFIAERFYGGAQGEAFKFKSVAGAFQSKLDPKTLIGNNVIFDYFVSKDNNETTSFLFIMLILICVNLAIAKSLAAASFTFIGRIVWIIYYMISAPFYFLSLFLPLKSIPGGKMDFYQGWLLPLLSRSFCIVVYLFLIWLSLLVLGAPAFESLTLEGVSAPGGHPTTAKKLADLQNYMVPLAAIFLIKAIFVIIMLNKAQEVGSKMCEDGANTMGKLGAVAGGFLGGVGKLGGSAVVRRIVGRTLGKGIAESKWANRWAASGKNTTFGKLGKLSLQAGMKMESLQFGGKSYNEKFKERQEEEERIKRRMTTENRRKRSFAEYGLNLNKLDSKEILGFEDDKLNKAYREAGEAEGIGQQAWLDKNRNRLGDITADQIMISKDVIEKAKNKGKNIITRVPRKAVDFLFPDRKESIEALENKQAGVSGVQKEMKDVEDRRKEINKKIEDRVRETDQVAVGLNFAIESASSDVDINQFLEENKEKLSTLGIKEEEIMKNFEELQGVRKEASVKRQGLVEEIQKAEIGDTSGNIKGLREKLTRAEKSMEDSGAFVSAGDKEMVGKLREQISKAKKSSEGLFKLKDKLNQYDIKISREEASLVGGLEKTINDANRRANEGVKEQYRPENDQLEDEGQQLINEKREILEEFAKGVKSEDRLTKESARSA